MNVSMMRGAGLLLLMMCCAQISWGQQDPHRLSNGGFENFSHCPTCHNNGQPGIGNTGLPLAKKWDELTGSPEYYNLCVSDNTPLYDPHCFNVDVPKNSATVVDPVNEIVVNVWGATNSYADRGYAGLYGLNNTPYDMGYESITIELDRYLTPSLPYDISFSARLAPGARLNTTNVGMLLSDGTPTTILEDGIPVQPQLITTDFLNETQWQNYSTTITATGNERTVTIGIFLDEQTQAANPLGMFNGAYFFIDEVKVRESCQTDASFDVELACSKKGVEMQLNSPFQFGSSQYNLYEMDPAFNSNPCTSDACMVDPSNPIAIETGLVGSFDVALESNKYYIIKHGVYSDCFPWSEQRQLVKLPNLGAGNIVALNANICEGEDMIVNFEGIDPLGDVPWTLTVERIELGNSQVLDSKTYYGCGQPTSVNFSDPVASGLFNTALTSCPTYLTPDATPYSFFCPGGNAETFYNIRMSYEVCGQTFHCNTQTKIRVYCGPNITGYAQPLFACPGDLVTYNVWDPTLGSGQLDPNVTYTWFQGGVLIGSGGTLTQIYDPSLPGIYVEAVDNINGCKSVYQTVLAVNTGCIFDPGGGGKGRKRTARKGFISSPSFEVPNPIQDVLTIRYQLESMRDVQVELWSLTGQRMYQSELDVELEVTKIDVAYLATGIYILRVQEGEKMIHQQKIVVTE